MTSPFQVEIKNLNKWYGEHHVLRNISLGLAPGEKIVLCGPSGSGKSSLIRCINGLEPFQEGGIVVCGAAQDGTPAALAAVRRHVGMVFQNFNLFSHLTVTQNLTLGAMYVGAVPEHLAVARADALLARVGLADQAGKYPGQLSGGQRQRVAICRALMQEPDVLLFDEPTSALDPEMVREVLDLMEELAASGQSMIVVTHEMEFARRAADLIVFMDRGEIVEAAAPGRFFDAPETERARAFLGQIGRRTDAGATP